MRATWIQRGRCFTPLTWQCWEVSRENQSYLKCLIQAHLPSSPGSPATFAPPCVPPQPTFSKRCQPSPNSASVCARYVSLCWASFAGYLCTLGFPHLSAKLSPPQKESGVLPNSLDYTASSAGTRQLTLLCNHHYPHKDYLSRVTRQSALKYHTITVM